MQIKDVTGYLESIAPKPYQESYDNSGLLTGDAEQEVTGILVTLDCTEEVIQEAIDTGANLIVAHHPVIFKGLKKLTGSNYVERTVIKAIRNNIGIYAIHTNLDNVITGVNRKIAEKAGLQNLTILSPKKDTLAKLVTFIPVKNTEAVLMAMHEAGAGQIGDYKNCSFRSTGQGAFLPSGEAKPHIGNLNKPELVDETRVEVIFPSHLESQVVAALKKNHPYEEVAYYLSPLTNENQEVGSGILGETPQPIEPLEFLNCLKTSMELTLVRHTRILNRKVSKIAVCGGSGSFLLPKAIAAGADVFITADFKYHEFFDANDRLIIADIGHYESEIFTKELIQEYLIKKFPTFAINFSKTVTNPISYL